VYWVVEAEVAVPWAEEVADPLNEDEGVLTIPDADDEELPEETL
jgi:hypothetical protein